MSESDAISILQQAVWITIVAAGPMVLSAMLVGTAIAVLQALTQVQEMTLTFIPKMVVGMLVFAMTAPYVGNMLKIFVDQMYGHISNGFG
jgi:flagellar biosynthetic protein FliQ